MKDKLIEPGSRSALTMVADLRRKHGPVHVICTLKAATGETWMCDLQTTLYSRLECTPSQFSFGIIEPQKEATAQGAICVYSRNSVPPMPAFSANSDSRDLRVSPGESTVEQLGDGVMVRRVPLTLSRLATASVGYGRVRKSLQVDVVCDARHFDLAVPVTWAIRSAFEVVPGRAFFGQLPRASSRVEKQLRIRRLDGKSFRVTDVKPTNSMFLIHYQDVGKAVAHTVKVLFDPTRIRPDQHFVFGELNVSTDNAGEPILQIPLAAILR
jgi:hypothetical protein